MWQPDTVERALFRWQKWRKSIITKWMDCQHEANELGVSQLKLNASQELQQLGICGSLWFELYWICSIASDFNLDYPITFQNIIIPSWLPLPFHSSLKDYEMEHGTRRYPPTVVSEEDIVFQGGQHPPWIQPILRRDYSRESSLTILLPSSHEIHEVLIRGRPNKSGRRGCPPHYSDRLAVECATLKDKAEMTNVEVANKVGLPVRRYWGMEQSYSVVNLIRRGRKLISEVTGKGRKPRRKSVLSLRKASFPKKWLRLPVKPQEFTAAERFLTE